MNRSRHSFALSSRPNSTQMHLHSAFERSSQVHEQAAGAGHSLVATGFGANDETRSGDVLSGSLE